MNEIYVVIGSAGQYDEWTTWIVCAYADSALAELHAQKAQRCANRIDRAQRAWRENRMDRWPPEDTTFFNHWGDPLPGANPYDPNMQFRGGCGYHVENVPFPATVARFPREAIA